MPQVFRVAVDAREDPPLIDSVFLGWEQLSSRSSSFYAASNEDSVAILGPPRVGKTSGVLIPQAMTWAGSVISASTKPDVLRATRGRRLEIAVLRGGDVYAYAPTDPRGEIGGVRTIHWSPADGCEDPATCEIRVQKLLGPEKPTEDEFFRQAGAAVMRAFLHAVALGNLPMSKAKEWIDKSDVEEPINILHYFKDRSFAAPQYASALEGIAAQPPETKAGTFGTVREKLAAIVGNVSALANSEYTDFSIDQFLRTGSTLYIVSPEDNQRIVAPLVAGLVEAIVSRAYSFASESMSGRLDPGLLLLLDEVGAIAPLPSLPAIMAQGASQGVLCVWAGQSIAQLEARWGREWASAIWGASSQKLLFGNLADTELLERISQQFGEYDRRVNPHGGGLAGALASMGGRGGPPQLMRERKVQLSQLHEIPPGAAWLIALTPNGPAVEKVQVPPAGITAPFAQAQQREAEIQRWLEARGGAGASLLREQAIFDVSFKSMSVKEQERFKAEEAALTDRLSQLAMLGPPERAARLRSDADLSREEEAARHVASLSPEQQMRFRMEVLSLFANGGVPHYTYTVGRAPPSSPAPPRRSLRRDPERYGMKDPP